MPNHSEAPALEGDSGPNVLPLPSRTGPDGGRESIVGSYRRLAEIFHQVLSEQSPETLLDRIADVLSDLIPYDTLTIHEADEERRILVPVVARDQWAEEILNSPFPFGRGVTGWAVDQREPVLVNDAHLDPRLEVVPGTPPDEPEALICVPLVARGSVKGALNIYRLGEGVAFTEDEFELAKRFGDAAALAVDNLQVRARLEQQAQTDSLTGLHNHGSFHERLRAELNRASRAHDSVSLLMLDIDDFKRVNDVHGHGTGDQVLAALATVLRGCVRTSDVVCRIGGEEFGVIMPSCDAGAAFGLARRITARLESTEFDVVGRITVSLGVAEGPAHAMNPRELYACAESAMMTAKARGKNQIVLFDDGTTERPNTAWSNGRDVRSIAHLKMLQSLAGKLNRLSDVERIGEVIVTELRSLVDYHNCRVYVVEGDECVPVAFRGVLGEYEDESVEMLRCEVGEGITGHVAEMGESVLLANALDCEFAVDIPDTDDIDESMVAVALRYGTRVIGVIVLSKLGVGQFDEDDVRLLEVLAGHASVAIENARLYEAQRREAESAKESAEVATALLEFGRRLAHAEGLDEVLARVVELSAKIIASPRVSVWLQDAEDGDLSARAFFGYEPGDRARIAAMRFPVEVARVFLEREESFVLGADEIRAIEGVGKNSTGVPVAVAPLHFEAGRLGCVVVTITSEGEFDEKRMRLLAGIAHQAKLAIANASSFESLERTFFSTVEALANALEANDEYTSSHARSISDLACRVGAALSLDQETLKRIELAALFHDIGKIGIPSEILRKPGALSAEEWEIMKRHPELGERILAPIDRLADVHPIVRHCHEHWNGAGYPDGMAENEIPIEARIVLVCDAYHAMTSDRPYRGRLPESEARRRLEEAAGTQFDPEVVAVFLGLLRSGELAPTALA